MRRVGYVLKKFPRLSETFILTELLALEERGLAPVVYSLRAPDAEPAHPELARLRAPVRVLAEVDRSDESAQAQRVAELARADGVVHLHAHFATIAARVAARAAQASGLPYSVTAHAKDLYRDGVDRAWLERLVRGAAAFITVCDANVAHLRRILPHDALASVRRLYNGIDIDRFAPDASGVGGASGAGDARSTAGPPIVLAVARLVRKKGLHVLLDALALLARRGVAPQLRIVGDGEERAALQQQAARLGLASRVEFTGALRSDGVRRELAAATLFCLPCITDDDGNRDALPTVLLEALAAGVPCLSTRLGGVPEILDDGRAGALVEPGDASALAAALEELLRDEPRRTCLAFAGEQRVRALFDRRRAAAELALLFGAAS